MIILESAVFYKKTTKNYMTRRIFTAFPGKREKSQYVQDARRLHFLDKSVFQGI